MKTLEILKMPQEGNISVLIYTSKIIFSGFYPYLFLLYMFLQYFKLQQRQRLFLIECVSDDLLRDVVKKRCKTLDFNNIVLVNNSHVFSDTSYICLFIKYKNRTFKKIALVVNSGISLDNSIQVNSTFMYNIRQLKGGINSDKDEIFAQIIPVCSEDIKIATQIELCVINGPYEINNFIIDTVIKNYFKKPKLVVRGDLIAIDLRLYGENILYAYQNPFKFNEYVFFKCKNLNCSIGNGGTYFCIFNETTIKQSANIQSFLPSSVKISIGYGQEILGCPYGLEKYFNTFERLVLPFIQKNSLKKHFNIKPTFLICGKKGSGKEWLVKTLSLKLGMHFYKISNIDVCANVYAQTETKLRNIFMDTKLVAPCILFISNFESFGQNNEGQNDDRIIDNFLQQLETLFQNNTFPIIVFCSSNEKDVPTGLKREFLEVVNIDASDVLEREHILTWILEFNHLEYKSNLKEIASKTSGFLFEDLKVLIFYARQFCISCTDNCTYITETDLLNALDYMQKSYNESLGAPKVPKVQWSDIGGLNDVKEEIIKTISFPLKHAQLLKSTGLKRSGILLFGPPGTGKTLLAKAVATECNLCFLSVKGPELLNMYVGQSEENVREIFERARQASPCIIFFDELDSLAPNRGFSGDSAGVMDRVVSQLLAEMDGLNDKATVFIIGATNRPDLIDPALLRPGRFDKLLYVGPCTENSSKLSVLKALTRKFKLEDDVDLEKIVEECPPNISGADFYGICSNAWLSAVRRLISQSHKGSNNVDDLTHDHVNVSKDDFDTVLSTVKPSISAQDMKYFEHLKKELSSNDGK